MINSMKINDRNIGAGYPVYIVAEMSANHNRDFNQAVRIIEAAKEAGADAIKIQTFTADTMTINVQNEFFKIKDTIWNGKNLYDLYSEASTPWDWQPKLKEAANKRGLEFFSTPFDPSAVDFLEKLDVPVYKVASFELVDLPLLKRIAKTGKPVIMSTGMASLVDISEAVKVFKESGGNQRLSGSDRGNEPANNSEPGEDLRCAGRTFRSFHRHRGIHRCCGPRCLYC